MESLSERLIKKADIIVEDFIEGYIGKKQAIKKLQKLRDQCHDEQTDQEIFERQQDVEEYNGGIK